MHPHEHPSRGRSNLVRNGLVTAAAVVLAFMALDDITTDLDQSFWLERSALAACECWFAFAAYRLFCTGRRAVGALSLGVIALATPAQFALGPGAVPGAYAYVAYFAVAGGLAWFAVLSGFLVYTDWRPVNPSSA
jgi:hypothetical protein